MLHAIITSDKFPLKHRIQDHPSENRSWREKAGQTYMTGR